MLLKCFPCLSKNIKNIEKSLLHNTELFDASVIH